MATNESVNLFVRLVLEKHKVLKDSSDQLLRALVTEDPNKKKNEAKVALQAAQDLRGILATQDVPNWLVHTINALNSFVGGSWTSYDLLANYIPARELIDSHQWVFQEDTERPFDFDAIYEHFKKDSRLPELFDSIVKLLEDIQGSGEVDSMAMLKALGKVIATIKRSKDGSYFSLNSAWEFLLSFLKNYMWGELSKIPMLGTALEALEKTIKETNEEMFKLHQQVQEEMNKTVESEMQVLKNKSDFSFITYDRQGHWLTAPTTPALPNITA